MVCVNIDEKTCKDSVETIAKISEVATIEKRTRHNAARMLIDLGYENYMATKGKTNGTIVETSGVVSHGNPKTRQNDLDCDGEIYLGPRD